MKTLSTIVAVFQVSNRQHGEDKSEALSLDKIITEESQGTPTSCTWLAGDWHAWRN
jgi:hypothetical protein